MGKRVKGWMVNEYMLADKFPRKPKSTDDLEVKDTDDLDLGEFVLLEDGRGDVAEVIDLFHTEDGFTIPLLALPSGETLLYSSNETFFVVGCAVAQVKHTPEPWEHHRRLVVGDCEKQHITNGKGCTIGFVYSEADAERIVACVNACAGIADPSAVQEMREALTAILGMNPDDYDDYDDYAAIVKYEATRALAKAEGR